jgi:hypothetical protein
MKPSHIFGCKQAWYVLFCCALFISPCSGIGVPNLKIADLVAASDVIIVAHVHEVKQEGSAPPVIFRGQAIAAHKYAAEVDVLSLLKGSAPAHLSLRYSLPDTFIGYQGLRPGTRTIFLRRSGNAFDIADPYHPDLPALVPEPLVYPSGDYVAAIEQGMLAVIGSPSTTAGEKAEILRFDYELPRTKSTIVALKSGLASVQDEDLRQRIEGELINFGDLAELPEAVSLLLRNAATSNQHVWLLYVIGNKITDPVAIPSLRRLLDSNDSTAREAAVQALWHIGVPAVVRSLAVALEDPDEPVRFYAVRGCADIANEFGWGGPSESEFREHEQQYLDHWRMWAKNYQAPQ